MFQDKVTLNNIAKAHPKVRDEALAIYNELVPILSGNAQVRFIYIFRTFAEQQALYNQGRTTPGKIVTKARPGYSFHNYGLAIDICLLIDKNKDGFYETASWDMAGDYDGDKIPEWQEIVNIFVKHGWGWGGNWKSFKDYPHFQKIFGYSELQLLNKHNNKKVDKEGYVII